MSAPGGPSSWSDLTSAALVGTARRPVGAMALPGEPGRAAAALGSEDPSVRLLDLAALATVYRRAGRRVRPAPYRPSPVAADDRPVVSRAAAQRLEVLLSRRDRELLTAWLRLVVDRGLRPPPRLLPALLDLAVREQPVAELVLAAAGTRGRWLAARRPSWAPLLAPPPLPGEAAPEAGHPAHTVTWELGSPPQRRAWLAERRRRHPAAAAERLAADWDREAPAERAGLLAVLADGLAASDEPFLERCLDDRRADVREVAAALLARLPGSRYAERARHGARRVVRVEGRGPHRRLAVTVPPAPDTATVRQQPSGAPPDPAREGAAAVLSLVAAAPLDTWVPALAENPCGVTALDVVDGWRPTVWAGWARAALRERDPVWAQALLGSVPPGVRHPPGVVTSLLALVARDDRDRWAARLLAEPALPAVETLDSVPGPWTPPVAAAVIARLARLRTLDDHDALAVLDLAGRRLSPDQAPALAMVAAAWPEHSPLRRQARRAGEMLAFRRQMLEELQ